MRAPVGSVRPRWKPRRVFVAALALSVAVHAAFSLWPEPLPADVPDDIPLEATLTELPPPPAPAVAPRPLEKKRPHRAPRRVVTRPAPAPEAVAPSPPAPPPETVAVPPPMAAPELPQDDRLAYQDLLPAPVLAIPVKTLPPRVDLAYRVFWGTRGFFIGDATYRFEHHDSHYRIATVGQARGLAALILRGEGKLESEGEITSEGLKPDAFALVRGKGRKREVAQFDWTAGIVNLEDDKSAPLDAPTFDPLTFLWQFYFLPPSTDQQTFAIATTKRVYRYTFTREGSETIELPSGPIEAERWHRRSEDGKSDAYVWLAPKLQYVAVKVRVSNTERGTVEALLDAIRVDRQTAANP